MPKLVNKVPKYRKHRASGQAVVTLNGRDFYLGPHGTQVSRASYDRLTGEWLQQGRQIRPAPESDELTVVELMAGYLNFARQYYRKGDNVTGEYAAIRCALRVVKPSYGRSLCSEFGPIALQAVMQLMVDEGLARRTVNQNAGRIKRMFKWGAAQQLIDAAIPLALSNVQGLQFGRCGARETKPVAPIADQIVESTIGFLPEIVQDMVRLQRLTGMRPGEVCIMKPIEIDRSEEVWIYRPESHKTQHHGKERVIFIGPLAQEILARYLNRDSSLHCFSPCESETMRRIDRHANRKTPLSWGNKPGSNRTTTPKRTAGDFYTVDGYRRAIHRACDAAFAHPHLSFLSRSQLSEAESQELRAWRASHHWSPNQLRHSAATEIRREFGLEAAQIALGHSQANVTQIYAKRDMLKGIEVARKIG